MEKLVELVSKDKLKAARRAWLQLMRLYFRVEVEGIENIPAEGAALVIANHSGYAGADALMLGFIIKRETKRRARILAHRAFFDLSESVRSLSETFGLRKASVEEGVQILKDGRVLIIFPEGESGNFKPSSEKYRLQRFRTGFLRMAIQGGAPIVPCTIIGAEESYLNLGNIDLSAVMRGLKIPIPLNLIPLPAKWKITFHPPVPSTKFEPDLLEDPDRLDDEATRFQKELQKSLREQLKKRKYVYSVPSQKLQKKVSKTLKILKKRLKG